MENKKEYCRSLYNKYRELDKKTKLVAIDYEELEKVNIPHIECRDVEEKIKLEKKLPDCLEFLADEQLKELSVSDSSALAGKAMEILVKRKRER